MNSSCSAIVLGLLLSSTTITSAAESATPRKSIIFLPTSEAVIVLPSGAAILAELESTLDSKKAKVGDQVIARTTDTLKTNGNVLLPKNTRLLGHVTQAAARSKGDSASILAILFDRAIIKKGQEISFKVVIQALAAAPRLTMEAAPDPSTMPSGTAAAQGSPMGGAHGATGGTSPTSGLPAPESKNAGTSVENTGDGINNSGRLTPKSHGVFGLEGLHLATDETSAEKGSLITTSGKSVHLESGIKLLLLTQ